MKFKNYITESKPNEVETYKKIKDFNIKALKGYARKIKLDDELINQRNIDKEILIDEIMGFLYDDNWERALINAGVL